MFKHLLVLVTFLLCCTYFPNNAFSEVKPLQGGINVRELASYKNATKDLSADDREMAAVTFNLYLKQYRQVIPILKKLVVKYDQAGVWNLLAFSYNRVGAWQDAYNAASASIKLEPGAAFCYGELGMAALQLGKYAEAERNLAAYLRTHQDEATAHYYHGLSLAQVGRLPEARVSLNMARLLNPDLAILTDYYIALIDTNQGRSKEALKSLQLINTALGDVDTPFLRHLQALVKQIQAAETAKQGSSYTMPLISPDGKFRANVTLTPKGLLQTAELPASPTGENAARVRSVITSRGDYEISSVNISEQSKPVVQNYPALRK